MAIADYRKELEEEARKKATRTSIFSTQTKNVEDFKSFVNACTVYMGDKIIEKINISLSFEFLELEEDDEEEDKKK